MTLDLVCDCCGSGHIYDVQRSVDDRWLLAKCRCHKGIHPLVAERAYIARRKRPAQAKPSDLFGALSPEELRKLAQAVKLHD